MRNRSLPEKLSSIAQTASLNLTTLGILLNFMKMRCKGSAAKESKNKGAECEEMEALRLYTALTSFAPKSPSIQPNSREFMSTVRQPP